MNTITFAFAGFALFSTWAHAAETLDANAVKKLITGNTVHGLTPNGKTPKSTFHPTAKHFAKGMTEPLKALGVSTMMVRSVLQVFQVVVPRSFATMTALIPGSRLRVRCF